MKNSLRFRQRVTLVLISVMAANVLALCSPEHADAVTQQQPQEKKVLTIDDYGRWNRVDSASISPDGKWVTYAYSPNEGDKSFFIKQVDSEDKPTEIAMGSSPVFSNDSKWLTYMVSPGEKEVEKLKKSKQPIVNTLHLMNLETRETRDFEGAVRATFPKEGSGVVAISMGRPSASGGQSGGSDLLIVDLVTHAVRNIGNVGSFAFNKTGELVAYTVDAADQSGNGLYLLEPGTGMLRPLDTFARRYRQLTWNEDGEHLAVLRGDEKKGFVQNENELVVVMDVASRSEAKSVYSPAEDKSFPEKMVVSELRRLEFSDDGAMVFTGLKEQKKKATDKRKADEKANVDVWHWQDDLVQSVQQRRASRDRRSTHAAAFHVEKKKLVQLGDKELSRVSIAGKGRWAVGVDDTKYRAEISWGGRRGDYYRVDLNDGKRELITEGLGRPMGYSPDGKYFVFLKEKQVMVYDLDKNTTTNLSKATGVNFVNEDDDHPYEKPAYGIAGWTDDGSAVILNHKFDLWQMPLDGSKGTSLTSGIGDKEQIRFRYVRLDREEETIDTTKPMLLSAYGEWTKKSGYYSLTPGEQPQLLIFEDKRVGRPVKAKDSESVLLTMQTFEDFPDYWVTTTKFESPKKITDANPQQSEYLWGRRILVDYKNSKDVKLQATLALPGNFEEGKKYPMLVYFYEKMSQRHHEYSMPRYDDRPHMSTYASDGYLVLMPDVVYEVGRPGSSALDCVTSAVQAVIDMGHADPEHIVLQGHSWGGYQSSFILTQTDMFAAVVTGAPVTNLVSFHGELYKSSGSVQQGITEKGQVRMGTSPWDDMELFHSQSPVHNVKKITTPFMILHGTDDGAVDWHQGLEYYNAARRNGKQVILLSYPGEGHHLSNRGNQIDFQIRMKQFFDHYAKGTEAPEWMKEGVPFLEKETARPRPEPAKKK